MSYGTRIICLSYCHVTLAKPCKFPTYTVTNVMRPSRGWGWVPLKKKALFTKNKIVIFYVPCSPKLPVFPLFLGLCSPVPQKNLPLFPCSIKHLGGPVYNIGINRGFLCTNICQVPIFPISDILYFKKYPEMGRGFYSIVSSRKDLLYR